MTARRVLLLLALAACGPDADIVEPDCGSARAPADAGIADAGIADADVCAWQTDAGPSDPDASPYVPECPDPGRQCAPVCYDECHNSWCAYDPECCP